MIKKFYPSSLYNFLSFIHANPVNKKILDCGAGGGNPKLAFFYENGFETYGIDISDEQLERVQTYCEENSIDLGVIKGNMKSIPFESELFGYVFSYLSMVHLSKNETKIAINEIHRVLVKGGLCYLNFLSKDDINFDEKEESKPGEVISIERGQEEVHSYYEDNEPDEYLEKFEIIYKEKRHVLKGKYFQTGRTCILDYIMKKI